METNMPKIVKSVFTLAEKLYLNPHYIRVMFHMTEKQVEDFRNVDIGANNKIFIPAKGFTAIDCDDDPAWDALPFIARRTYTTRNIDRENAMLWIDFVAHGDNGPASAWVIQAQPGDVLGIAMKDRNRPLVPQKDHYLLAGDMTAIPVISAILEQISPYAKARVILEVYSPEEQVPISSAGTLDLVWLHNPDLDKKSMLPAFLQASPQPPPGTFVYIAAESDAVNTLKAYFRNEKNWPKNDCSIQAYWKRGQAEDEPDAERTRARES